MVSAPSALTSSITALAPRSTVALAAASTVFTAASIVAVPLVTVTFSICAVPLTVAPPPTCRSTMAAPSALTLPPLVAVTVCTLPEVSVTWLVALVVLTSSTEALPLSSIFLAALIVPIVTGLVEAASASMVASPVAVTVSTEVSFSRMRGVSE